jgi:hypothetical protein
MLQYDAFHNVYVSPNIIRVIRSKSMRWVGHVVRVGEMRSAYNFSSKNLKGRDYSEDLGADGRIILECILAK